MFEISSYSQYDFLEFVGGVVYVDPFFVQVEFAISVSNTDAIRRDTFKTTVRTEY